ncbi:MAG: hypothetical protein L0Y44_12065 [Phycisphaerales bacterium]|nr:hypothetical protein [Phycisphaerales bacterium]MCI0675339.1 hypothetical protein [Phycisphaerales bacterium]
MLATGSATGRVAADAPVASAISAEHTTTAPVSDAAAREWSFSLSAYTYIIPDDRDYVQPTFTADYDWLHLEARYNYEDLDTASAWIGYNLSFGDELTLDFTPMIGGVFGDTTGVAPGYEVTLAWRQLELYSEGEYVIDTRDSSGNFFYTWSELTFSPTDWLRAGVVIQRTKTYDTDFDIQRGLLVGLTFQSIDLTAYVFNPDDDPTVVLGIRFQF